MLNLWRSPGISDLVTMTITERLFSAWNVQASNLTSASIDPTFSPFASKRSVRFSIGPIPRSHALRRSTAAFSTSAKAVTALGNSSGYSNTRPTLSLDRMVSISRYLSSQSETRANIASSPFEDNDWRFLNLGSILKMDFGLKKNSTRTPSA